MIRPLVESNLFICLSLACYLYINHNDSPVALKDYCKFTQDINVTKNEKSKTLVCILCEYFTDNLVQQLVFLLGRLIIQYRSKHPFVCKQWPNLQTAKLATAVSYLQLQSAYPANSLYIQLGPNGNDTNPRLNITTKSLAWISSQIHTNNDMSLLILTITYARMIDRIAHKAMDMFIYPMPNVRNVSQ